MFNGLNRGGENMEKKEKLPTEQELLEIIDKVERLPFAQRVKITHHLNSYKWIDELPGKPEGFEKMSIDEKAAWVSPICQYMSKLIGDKALLRYFHITELGRTDQEFEDWWDSMRHDPLTMFKQENYNIENYATQRANDGTDKRNPPIVPFFFGFLVGSVFVELLILFFKIVGIL